MGRFDSPLSVATLFIGATCVSVALIFLFDAEATSRINREKIAGKQVISASREEGKGAEAAGRTENLERIQDSGEKVQSVTWDVRSEDGEESSTTEKGDESIFVFFKRKLKDLFKRHHRWKRSLKESDEERSDEDPGEPVALFLTQKFPLADYNRGDASSLALSASSASTSSTGLGGGNGANGNSNGLESGGKSGVHPGVSSGGFHKIRHAMKKLGSGGLDLSMVERMILDSNPSRTRNSDDNPEGDRKGNYHGHPAGGGGGHGRPKPPPPPLLPNNDDKSERELSSARRISPPLNPYLMEAGGESKRISSSGSETNFERESTTWSSWISRSGGSSNVGRNTVTGPGSGTGNLSESVERDRRASSGSTTATPTTPSKAWKERDGAEKGSGHGVWNSLKNGRQRFRLDSPADLEQEKERKGGRGAGSSVMSEDSLESFSPPRDLDGEVGVGSAGNLGSDGGRKRIITTNNDQGPASFVPQHHHSGHYHEGGEGGRGKERKVEEDSNSSWGHKRGPFLAGIAGGRNSADHTDIFAYPPGYVTSENHVREENLQARHSGGSLDSKGYYSEEEDGDEEEGKEGKSGDGLEEGEDSSHEDETDSNGTKDEGENIYMTDTKRSILKENVEICYKTDDVLIVVAITCCLNFAFVLVIWGCVRWFSISSSAKDREFHHLDCEDGGDSILFHEDGVDGGGRDDHEEDCCWKRRVCIDFEGGGSGGGEDMTSLKRKACREKVVGGLDGGFGGKGGLMGDDKRARVGELIEESKISSSPSSFMPSSILSLGRTEENEDEKLLSPLALPFPKSRVPSLRRPSDRFHFVLQKHYQRNLKEFGLGFIPPYNCSSGAEDGERESVCNFDNDRSSLYNQGNYYPRPSNRLRGRGAADKESTRSRTNNIVLPPTRTSTSMYSIRVCDNKLVPRKSGKTSGGLASSYSSSSSNSSSLSSSSSSTSSSLKKRAKRRKNGEKCYSHSMEDLRYIRT